MRPPCITRYADTVIIVKSVCRRRRIQEVGAAHTLNMLVDHDILGAVKGFSLATVGRSGAV